MANSNYSDFKEIVRDIDDRKILLPDFQRDFVWKDEERQKKIVASVLTKMPIGSILLLTSSADEYCSKIIGRNADLNTSDITGDVDFLLDGQQRITVLTNVFSNVIHDKCPRVSELVSPSLKRRFFLKIPKWIDVHNGKEADLFGIQTLAFPLANPDVDIPEFLSGEILSFIETQTFNANDNKPYNPHNNLGCCFFLRIIFSYKKTILPFRRRMIQTEVCHLHHRMGRMEAFHQNLLVRQKH